MGLFFAAKFCQLCHQSDSLKDKSSLINQVAEQICLYEDYWLNKYYNEEIDERECNANLSIATTLEKICFYCDGYEAKIFNMIYEGEVIAKDMVAAEELVQKKKALKKKVKKLKLKIDGNVYWTKLFKKGINKK